MSHNIKSTMEAAAAIPMMCPLWVKELYVGSLSNADVKKHLRGFLDLPLQQLQAKALDLEAGFPEEKKKPHQNPERVMCPTCSWWHNPSKGEKCKCKGDKPKPLAPYRPRVQEVGPAEDAVEGCEDPWDEAVRQATTSPPEEDLF